MKDQQRAAFEECAKTIYFRWGLDLSKAPDGDYLAATTGIAWETWQAALASPEVRALREDAGRYRWLRDDNAYFPEENNMRGGEELDLAIDKQMKEER